MIEKSFGLLLQSIPYLAGRRILKILTEQGLLSLMASSRTPPILTAPFAWAEWVYTKRERDIETFKDGTLLNDFSALKESYSRLQSAGQIASDLLRTQFPGKPASAPLALGCSYFDHAPLFQEPPSFAASFRLKLLSCEGLLHPEELETPLLQTLAFSRSFRELASLSLHETDIRAIDLLFETRLELLSK